MSTGPGPWYQNPILPLTTPLLGGKKVVFAYPRLDQATVRHFAQLMEPASSHRSSTGSTRWIRSPMPTGMPRPGK